MARKLAISNKVVVNVKGQIAGETKGSKVSCDFDLTMDRLTQDQITDAIHNGGEIKEFLQRLTHGWDRQRLVLEEDGSPSDYSPEAFGDLLGIAGVSTFIYQSYLRQVGMQEKN